MIKTRLILSLASAAVWLGTSLSAQTRTDQLLAFVRSSAKPGSYAALQNLPGSCKKATKLAATLNGSAGSLGVSGGTAYDPTTDSVWISDGVKIRNQTLAGKTLCEFFASVNGKGWAVTGLAFKRSTRQLIQLEMGPSRTGGTPVFVKTYDTRKCPAVLQKSTCISFSIGGTGASSAGLAYDEDRDFLYMNTSSSGSFSWVHTIYVSKLAKPCTSIGKKAITVTNCSSRGGPITGLAYSQCSKILFVTFGALTREILMTSPVAGTVTDLTTLNNKGVCCSSGLPATDSIMGLAVLPGYENKTIGKSCMATSCGRCNSMTLGLAGVPVVGNQNFGFSVHGAPSGSTGFFYISVGACATRPLVLPGICGPIFPAIGPGQPILLAVTAVNGTTACNGTATLHTPLPILASLCNLSLCSQWLIRCKPSGTGLTNAVQFKIGG